VPSYPPRTSSTNSAPGAPPPYRYRSLLDTTTPYTHLSPQPPPPPRREIPDEDLCPVCHEEMPPKGPNGDTSAREAHVTDCIHEQLMGRPQASSPQEAGGPSASTSIPSASSSSLPAQNSMPSSSYASGSGNTHPMPRRMTGGRMLVYHAAEKDCMGQDDTAYECIICFEEFQEGDEMGRLECLCKFHRVSSSASHSFRFQRIEQLKSYNVSNSLR
jgi:hypothetical protein